MNSFEIKSSRSLWEVVHDSMEAVFQQRFTEVDQESQSKPGQSQLSQNLFAVNRGEFLHRLQFDDNQVLNDNVGPETLIEGETIVIDRDSNLPFGCESRVSQFMHKNHFVNRFEQSRPGLFVDLDSIVNNDGCDFVLPHQTIVQQSQPNNNLGVLSVSA